VKDPDGDAIGRLFPDLSWSTEMVRSRLSPGDDKMMNDLGSAHVGRAVWSSRQLFEVLVDFWSNHLNVPSPRDDVWDTRHRYDADVIRRHALGSFEELLVASAVHPAMLTFLTPRGPPATTPTRTTRASCSSSTRSASTAGTTRATSRRPRCCSPAGRSRAGRPVYDLESHWTGEVRVMRFTHPNATEAAGRPAQLAFLQYLAAHPATARTVARKLAVRFVADDPPDSLVERLAQVYTNGRTAILPVLRALFSSPEFAESAGRKVRRPFERLAATVRALDVDVPTDPRGCSTSTPGSGRPGTCRWPGRGPTGTRTSRAPGSRRPRRSSRSTRSRRWSTPGGRRSSGCAAARAAPGPARRARRRDRGRRPPRAGPGADVGRAVVRPHAAVRHPAARVVRDGSWEQEETIALAATLFLLSPSQLSR
jgi:hypothetical protein